MVNEVVRKSDRKTFKVYDIILRDNIPMFLIYDELTGWGYWNCDNFVPPYERD